MLALRAAILAIAAVSYSHQQTCVVQLEQAVFSAVVDTPTTEADVLQFDQILVDTVGGFDGSKTSYTAKSFGFYLLHMSAGVPAFQRLAYYLRNGSSTPGIFLSHNEYNGELISSRNDIQYITENQRLYISSDYPLLGDNLYPTSWSGFNIESLMNSLIVFRAARTSSLNGSRVVFDEMLINVGQGWDECNGTQFIVPRSGIYFLSWVFAADIYSEQQVSMLINGNRVGRTCNRAGYYPGIDTSSQTKVLYLNALDVITFTSDTGIFYSNWYYPASFTGFLYEPKHGQQIAWTLSFPIGTETYLYGPTIVNFTAVPLNEGSAWNESTLSVQIPVSGLYYLHLSGISYPKNYKFNMILTRNTIAFTSVKEEVDSAVKTLYYNLRSRALIVHLDQGDDLAAIIPDGFNAYSIYGDTSFAGFLVQPDVVSSHTQQSPDESISSPVQASTQLATPNLHALTCQPISVFSAALTAPYAAPASPLSYDVILVDTDSGFDASKTYYRVKQPGYYLFHFSAGVPAYQRLNMALNNASSTPNIILTHTTFDGDLVTSRDDIQYVNEDQRLYISSGYPVMSDSMMQTSWSGMRLDALFSPLILFRAARTTVQQNIGNVTYDKMLINVGGGWDACNSRFVAPQDGIYFFSWSSASVRNTTHTANLQLNSYVTILVESIVHSGLYNGSDTASNSVLLRLNAGDFVVIRTSVGPVYSDVNYQTSFLGFLYEPINSNKVAWSLAFNGNAYGATTIAFNNTLLAEGIIWNGGFSQVIILTTGTYYLKLSGLSYPRQYMFKMGLIVNGVPRPLIGVMDETSGTIKTSAPYYTERTRAIITPLQQGDTLEVAVPAGYEAGHDQNSVLFAGFLVY